MLLLVSDPLDSLTILSANVIHGCLSFNIHVEHAIKIIFVHLKGVLLGLTEKIFDFGDILVQSLILSGGLTFLVRCKILAQSFIFDTLMILGSG